MRAETRNGERTETRGQRRGAAGERQDSELHHGVGHPLGHTTPLTLWPDDGLSHRQRVSALRGTTEDAERLLDVRPVDSGAPRRGNRSTQRDEVTRPLLLSRGLTQQQLAERSGHPRETIARWETGAREPSLASLRTLVAACDLDLVIHLARRDPSLDELVADQLELTATERLDRLMPAAAMDDRLGALGWLTGARTPVIVIGGVAAVLQGGSQPPADGGVEFVSGDPYAMEAEMRRAGLDPRIQTNAGPMWIGSAGATTRRGTDRRGGRAR